MIRELGVCLIDFLKNPELRGKWLDVLGLKDDDISQNYAFLCSDHFSANDFVVCFSGGRFLKRDAVPSVSGRQQSDIEWPNKYTSEDSKKAVVPDVEDNRKLGSNTFLIKVEKNETVDNPTLKVQSLSDESTITGSFSSTGTFTASEIQNGTNQKLSRTLSLHKNNKCEELEGCLGIKLEEFEIKRRKTNVTGKV
ncbi:hypothetical protein NQ318_000076 [Aromia moschata]|uniref:THAP-type domain-containing protein n=1 Tax=Aromia moschata TaxID=1265417 RepID=A0AAV8YAK8_9CUCU|nr:hypothetical protein NQ318_000076 [Aromia moschata]